MSDRESSSFFGEVKRMARTSGAVTGIAARVAGERFLGIKTNKDAHAGDLKAILGGLKGPMMKGSTIQMGPSACLEIDGIYIAVASGKMQMLDRELFRTVGIHPEKMKVVVVKSSNHFRADFTPIASHVLIAKAPGPMAADPGDLPWKKLSPHTRTRP